MALLQKTGESGYSRSRDRYPDSFVDSVILVAVTGLTALALSWPSIKDTLYSNEPTPSSSPKQAVSAQAAETAAAVSSALAQRDASTPPHQPAAIKSTQHPKKTTSSKPPKKK